MNLEKLEELVEQGYLSKSEYSDLVLYNYTDKCTFEGYWNEYTLNARGTIYNKITGDIVSRAFPKFFNLDQHESSKLENLPNCDFTVDEKVDGSMALQFQHNGEFFISTRGSFYSEQAQKGTELLRKLNLGNVDWDTVGNLIFEVIYPENRIVVDYGNVEKLVLIGGYFKNGVEITLSLDTIAEELGCERPKRYNMTIQNLIDNAKTLSANEEGYVLKFPVGIGCFRVKIKGDEYMRISRLLSRNNYLAVWEALKDNKFDELIKDFPDEFLPELKQKQKELMDQHLHYTTEGFGIAVNHYNLFRFGVSESEYKNYALLIQKEPQEFQGVLFYAMRNGWDITKLYDKCWELVRPTGNKLQELKNYDI